mmetsp:Transcript_137001/g.355895  ORF Transcript_137001/g.355895 Transcript_137001/m.355895 type:complete len:248 (-) Transcript_137001:146-889(-)
MPVTMAAIPTKFSITTQMPAKPTLPFAPQSFTGSPIAMTIEPPTARGASANATSATEQACGDFTTMFVIARTYPAPRQMKNGTSMLNNKAFNSTSVLRVAPHTEEPSPGGAVVSRSAGEAAAAACAVHQQAAAEMQANTVITAQVCLLNCHREWKRRLSLKGLQSLHWSSARPCKKAVKRSSESNWPAEEPLPVFSMSVSRTVSRESNWANTCGVIDKPLYTIALSSEVPLSHCMKFPLAGFARGTP